MNRKVIAELCWLTASEGGRARPPPGPKYSTVARFDSSKPEDDAWSLSITFIDPPDALHAHRVEAVFLSDEAPDHLLSAGSSFDLIEGMRTVARGKVLSS